MQEDEIQARLRQNIPKVDDYTSPPKPEVDTTNGQATIAPAYELDEMVQYKLHDYFGEQYKPTNDESKQRVSYIYERVASMLDTPEYGFVVAKIRELERIIGTANSDQRIYRLYQWLKLENMRLNIDLEMAAING